MLTKLPSPAASQAVALPGTQSVVRQLVSPSHISSACGSQPSSGPNTSISTWVTWLADR